MALRYPQITPPGEGEAVPVAPDVLWVRIAMPCPPWSVNCWLLRAADGWSLVDTGPDTEATRSSWQRVFATALDGLPVRRVICTHHHFDHVGLAGAFCRQWQAPLLIPRAEWLMGRLLPLQWAGERPAGLAEFDAATGLPPASAEAFWQSRVLRCLHQSAPLPDSFEALQDGHEIATLGGSFRIFIASGHSPQAALLFDRARGILISGDQLLPRITPFIGVDYMEPQADPLGPYLDWLGRVAAMPDDPLVLPSHGLPFRGMAERAATVLAHHRGSMVRLRNTLVRPADVQHLTEVLFGPCEAGDHIAFATQECLAHLNRLEAEAQITRLPRDAGPLRFAATPAEPARTEALA